MVNKIFQGTNFFLAHPLYFSVDQKKKVFKTSRNDSSEVICEIIQLRWSWKILKRKCITTILLYLKKLLIWIIKAYQALWMFFLNQFVH